MSRVLARPMFKKKAPKRSAKGVGITSMLEDDVPGYAEGGEVNDDRTERERVAQMLLEQGREEYQRFSEGERPQMTRLPATMGMMPQPNPQQMQAAQMQQMAQMGMLPRFQEGGEVNANEDPSTWATLRDRLTMPFRERTGPILDPNTGEPFQFIDPNSAIDTNMDFVMSEVLPYVYGPARMAAVSSRVGRGIGDLAGSLPSKGRGPWEIDRTTGPWSRPTLPGPRAPLPQPKLPGPTGPSVPAGGAGGPPGTSVPRTGTPSASTPGQGGSWSSRIRDWFERSKTDPTYRLPTPEVLEPNREDEMEREREANRAAAFKNIAQPEAPKEQTKRGDRLAPTPPAPPPTGRKDTDLENIKAAREENKWLALMQAGLAIAGGRSPNAITNIGQGGQAGLASFMALEQQRRRDEDAAMRRSIAQREVDLQERRFKAQEPYIQAQTEYLKARPGIAAAQIQARQQAILARAQMKAVEDIDAQEAKNPMLFLGANGKPDPMKKQIALQRRTQELAAQFAAIYGGGGFSQDPLGLGLGGSADGE